MNAVLDRILTTESVSDGSTTLPLRHPDFPALAVHVDAAEGKLLGDIINTIRPATTIEIGMAYGVSTLYICDALAGLGQPAQHIAIDPFQSTQWRAIGLRNVREAGYERTIEFHEDRSELVLPRLVEQGRRVDFALIDGWHTFDQVLLEFYYIDRMLRPGGVVVFDDADRRSVNRAVRYAMNYPNYEVYPTGGGRTRSSWRGRARRALVRMPGADRLFRKDLLQRDWDLGILGSCVALRKTGENPRSSGWYRDF
jgi:predicted O-methyltransferase YrrM